MFLPLLGANDNCPEHACVSPPWQMVQHNQYSEKVDVFSLGCLMYELFSRQLCSAALLAKSGGDATTLKRHALQVRT